MINIIKISMKKPGQSSHRCLSAVQGAERLSVTPPAAESLLNRQLQSPPSACDNLQARARRCVLTFNLVFGQVHGRAVGEDVGDGAHAPVHQRGGDWMHRHGCDLWLPPAPSS